MAHKMNVEEQFKINTTLSFNEISPVLIEQDPPQSRFKIFQKMTGLLDYLSTELVESSTARTSQVQNEEFETITKNDEKLEGSSQIWSDELPLQFNLYSNSEDVSADNVKIDQEKNQQGWEDEDICHVSLQGTEVCDEQIEESFESLGEQKHEVSLEKKSRTCNYGDVASIKESPPAPNSELVTTLRSRLSESYLIQESLATENKTLETSKYQLEERFIQKEAECDLLQNQIDSLNNENKKLNETMGNNKAKESIHKTLESEASWLEKEMSRLRTELRDLRNERENMKLHNSSKTVSSLGKSSYEFDELRKAYDVLKGELDKALNENKKLITRESELVQAKTEIAQSEIVVQEVNKKYLEVMADKKRAAEEIEDLRSVLEDHNSEMQDYRKKYLQAQQRVEELNCELNEKQNEIASVRRESDEEIRIVKALYQEKVGGIDAVTTAMKEMQAKMYENQQQKLLLEAAIDEAKRELTHAMNQNLALTKTIEDEKLVRAGQQSERKKVEHQLAELESEYSNTRKENAELQSKSARLDEAVIHIEARLAEKTQDAAEAAKCLEELKTESLRQINRARERSESSKRSLQIQLAEIERELAAARAAVKAANKERDEIRNKLQSQINSLTETLEEGQRRWKALQAHVTTLQSSLCPSRSNLLRSESKDFL